MGGSPWRVFRSFPDKIDKHLVHCIVDCIVIRIDDDILIIMLNRVIEGNDVEAKREENEHAIRIIFDPI